jgi:hypothetical protein
MTAATVTEQEAVDRGWAAYRAAMDAMWPESVRRCVGARVADLLDALETYSLILNEDLHPVAAFEGIEPGGQAYDQAMTRAAANVTEMTGELVRVFPACGTEGSGQ